MITHEKVLMDCDAEGLGAIVEFSQAEPSGRSRTARSAENRPLQQSKPRWRAKAAPLRIQDKVGHDVSCPYKSKKNRGRYRRHGCQIPISLDPNRPRLYHFGAEVGPISRCRGEAALWSFRMTRFFLQPANGRDTGRTAFFRLVSTFACCC